MQKAIAIILTLLVILTTSCATYRPIVDMSGKSRSDYNSDLAQ